MFYIQCTPVLIVIVSWYKYFEGINRRIESGRQFSSLGKSEKLSEEQQNQFLATNPSERVLKVTIDAQNKLRQLVQDAFPNYAAKNRIDGGQFNEVSIPHSSSASSVDNTSQNPKMTSNRTSPLYMRLGVKSGGCSGMSYLLDYCKAESITSEVSFNSEMSTPIYQKKKKTNMN